MASRPYFKLGIKELEKLSELSDAQITKDIIYELGFRKTKKAKDLLSSMTTDEAKKVSGSAPGDHVGVGQRAEVGKSDAPHAPLRKPVIVGSDADADAEDGDEAEALENNMTTKKKVVYDSFQGKAWCPDRDEGEEATDELDTPLQNIILAMDIEIKSVQEHSRDNQIILNNGRKRDEAKGNYIYEFRLPEESGLSDDQPLEVIYEGDSVNGQVISVFEDSISISIKEDLGDFLHSVTVVASRTGLLERLKERFEEIEQGKDDDFQVDRIEKLFGQETVHVGVEEPSDEINLKDLKSDQLEAVRKGLGSELTWIWGPPGCGKSHTLAPLMHSFYLQGKQTLITANTNKAVDGLFSKLCKILLEKGDKGFLEGSVLRVGNLGEELEPYRDYIEVDAVADRLGQDLRTQLEQLSVAIEACSQEMDPLKEILNQFDLLDSKIKKLEDGEDRIRRISDDMHMVDSRLASLVQDIDQLDNNIAKRKAQSGMSQGLRRMFGGKSLEDLQSEMKGKLEEKESSTAQIQALNAELSELEEQLVPLRTQCESIQSALSGCDKEATKQRLAPLENELTKLITQRDDLERQLEDLRRSILENATVLACTGSKLFMSPEDVGGYDVAVIDEASMLTIPMYLYMAGRAKEKVILAGDFMQLPPIFTSKDKLVKDWFGCDPFDKYGITDMVANNVTPDNLVKLRTHFRCIPELMGPFNELFYGGDLVAGEGAGGKALAYDYPDLVEKPLTFLDTSRLGPFVSTPNSGRGRFNVMHAFAVRNLVVKLAEHNVNLKEVGVIAPYRAHVELIGSILDEAGFQDVVVGTVHRFQGSEKKLIIYDTVESPFKSCFPFGTASHPRDSGAKLINVALSRPQQALVMIGNLQYLYKQLKPEMYLARTISYVKERGVISDAKPLLQMEGADRDYHLWKNGIFNGMRVQGSLVLNEHTAMDPIKRDIAAAKKWIVIYSGFATSKGVMRLLELLRAKVGEGVQVRIVCRGPEGMGSIPPQDARKAFELLRGIGVSVDLRKSIHQKVIIVDDDIFYNGSLNLLSTRFNAEEFMMRIESHAACLAYAQNDRWRKASKARNEDDDMDILASFAQEENPTCDQCGGLMLYIKPKKKSSQPFLTCIDPQCGHTTNPLDLNTPAWLDMTCVKVCDVCGSKIRPRRSRKGSYFWACENYKSTKHPYRPVRREDFDTDD